MSSLTTTVGLAALALLGLGLLPGRLGTELEPEGDSPRAEAAQRALIAAGTHKRALIGISGARREALRQTAIEAYRGVLREHPGLPRIGAEAAFRAGELLRAAGRSDEAASEFRTAQRLGEGTPFQARAGLELGHLARRAKRYAEALGEYERVRLDARAELEQRHEATWWAGRVHAAEGRIPDAARLFERVARDAEDPLDQIRAFDAWATLLLEARDPEGAAGVLEQCRLALHDRALEETRFGARVRAALEGMRCRELLERAVHERLRREPQRLAPLPRASLLIEPDARPDLHAPWPAHRPPHVRGMGSSPPSPFPPTGF